MPLNGALRDRLALETAALDHSSTGRPLIHTCPRVEVVAPFTTVTDHIEATVRTCPRWMGSDSLEILTAISGKLIGGGVVSPRVSSASTPLAAFFHWASVGSAKTRPVILDSHSPQ